MTRTQGGPVLPDFFDVASFRDALITWGEGHYRPFPWRDTREPYRVLIAEIMLHRTRAGQVVPVYQSFLDSFPDVQAVAATSPSDILASMRSLGLRWRAELVQRMAENILEQFAGKVPRAREQLLSLPGISDYIASAVRCFAWSEADALIDTNTVRVVGRLCGFPVTDYTRRMQSFRALAQSLVDVDRPRAYHLAMLDHADAVCISVQEPRCSECPLLSWCHFGRRRMDQRQSADGTPAT